jgi:hypothetical protein
MKQVPEYKKIFLFFLKKRLDKGIKKWYNKDNPKGIKNF